MIYLTNKEYAKFIGEVNTYYFRRYKNKKYGNIIIDNTIYYFQIRDFDDYIILEREILYV